MLHKTIGKYRIEDVVGSGGMAIVYYAMDEELNRPTALKVLHKHWTNDQIARHRFKREAQIAQRLNHPNIVKIYEFDEIDETVFLAMEYVSGGSLAKRFQNPVAITLEQSTAMLTAIAQALDYAHAQGVIHRDLKLENILVGDDDRLILSDFGIARMVNSSRITDSGMVFGTPLYISPEQIQGVKNVDYRTDLYSFAVIAYLLTTGYHPFSGSTAQITAFQHMVEPPPPPSQLNPRLPQVFDDILVKGLAKAPADRYESASAQAAALAAAAQLDPLVEVMVLMRQPTPIISRSEPSRTGAITGPAATIQLDPPPPAPPPPPSRHFARFALIGLLLLVVLIGGFLITNGGLPIFALGSETPAPLVVLGSATATATATGSATATATMTATSTPTATLTSTATPTASATTTRTATATRTRLTPSATATAFMTNTPVATATAATATVRATTAAPTASLAALSQPSATSVPPTSAAPTSVPPTAVPPTPVPPTPVPPTPVPPTRCRQHRFRRHPHRRPPRRLRHCCRRFCRRSRWSAPCCRILGL